MSDLWETTPPADEGPRFVVKENRVSDDLRARYPNIPAVTYYVWDTVKERKVPFSNSQSGRQAQITADKLNARHAR